MNKLLIDFHFDFETRSDLDLSKVGSVKYAAHPSTQVTLLTWAFGRTGKAKAWRIGEAIPAELRDVLTNPAKYNFNALNIGFDYVIWIIPFFRQARICGVFGVRPGIKNITGTEALALHFRMGTSLEKTAVMLGMTMSKDKEGRRLMLKQCKRSAKTGQFYELTPDEWTKFERYGLIDTLMLREIYYKLPQLPPAERWIFEWTFKRNMTGIRVDEALVKIMDEIVNYYLPKLEQEFTQITGVKVKSPKAKDYFLPHFPWIQNMQADTVRDMLLRTEGVDPRAVRALELKSLAGSTSISKVKCAIAMTLNGKIYNLFEYHMAQTKRFAGRGIQIHNFPRPSHNPVDALPEDLNILDLASEVRARANTLKEPIDFVKNLLRRIWLPLEGQALYCGDFSKVEPTFLRWLTGMGPISDTAYEEMAVDIYNKPLDQISKDSEERQVGKAAVLGGGYAMGHVKFKDDTAKKTGIILSLEFSKTVINTYRRVNEPITRFWKELEGAFRKAIHGEGSALCDRKVFVMPMEAPFRGVQIRLPSGSYLYYHQADSRVMMKTFETVEIINNLPVVTKVSKPTQVLSYLTDRDGRIQRTDVYGGLLCEHVTSATARDLLTHSMYQLDEAGFDTSVNVHDEIWGGSHPGRNAEFERVMCILPYWCQDIKITADTGEGVRYLK